MKGEISEDKAVEDRKGFRLLELVSGVLRVGYALLVASPSEGGSRLVFGWLLLLVDDDRSVWALLVAFAAAAAGGERWFRR